MRENIIIITEVDVRIHMFTLHFNFLFHYRLCYSIQPDPVKKHIERKPYKPMGDGYQSMACYLNVQSQAYHRQFPSKYI